MDPIHQNATEPTTGPTARAKAPKDRKMPKTEPFWSSFPYFETKVVRQVTVKAVAKSKLKLEMWANGTHYIKLNPIYLQIAYKIMPIYSRHVHWAMPTRANAGIRRYKLNTA